MREALVGGVGWAIAASSPGGVAARGLDPLDWIILGLYGLMLVGTGVYFARRGRRLKDSGAYFHAGHAMPVWAVAISILATAQSAATFTGVPEQSYGGSLVYLGTNLGGIIAAVILAWVFIPRYYALGVTTPYQLLEHRFGPGSKLAASWAYMIGRVFASGSRVYVGAIPVSFAIFGDASPEHMAWAIAGFMLFGIVYTLWGGIASVIWTDVFQVSVYLGAAVVAVWLLASQVSVPWAEVVAAWREGGPGGGSKLTVIDVGVDLSRPGWIDLGQSMTLVTILTGFVLLSLASHGTDQDLVQRMLTCKSARAGSRSVILGVLVGVPAVSIFLALGLLLWVFYQRPELMGGLPGGVAREPGASSEVLLRYILTQMPAGAAGLMIAGVLAAGPAGINAGLNSMSSTFVSDVYRPWRPGRAEGHYLAVGRGAVVVWGVIMGAFALGCIAWREAAGSTIIDFVLGVMTFAYAGLLGVFFTALFTRRGATWSVLAGMATGFLVVLALQPMVYKEWASLITWTTTPPGAPGPMTRSLAQTTIAWPWHLVLGSSAAMAVCCLGKRRA